MKYRIISTFTLIVITFNACEQVGESVFFDIPKGSYAYFGYDTTSTLIAKGWFKIENEESGEIIGKWHLEKTDNFKNYGPQDGEGDFIGTLNDTSISINLHPDFADNNIILLGKIDKKYIYGKWQWITFIGVTNWGNFNAKKN
jgi:hypothetical protein